MESIKIDETVNFGKYKGKTFGEMLADRDYCRWLSEQSWSSEKFPTLLKAIKEGIKIAGESACTPEHNRMQARFLRDVVVHKLLRRLGALDVSTPENCIREDLYVQAVEGVPYNYKRIEFELISSEIKEFICEFEPANGSDIEIRSRIKKTYKSLTGRIEETESEWRKRIELKPMISDDYPAILRKAKANRTSIVICDKFNSAAVSFDQAAVIFKSSGITLLTWAMLDIKELEFEEVLPNCFYVH